jgi:phosphatidylinositol glycan class U
MDSRRDSHQPLLGIAIMCGIISTFKSYPTLGDAALWLGLLGCFPDIWAGESALKITFEVFLALIGWPL